MRPRPAGFFDPLDYDPMLPKSRIWSVLVLGLGVALLAAAISAGSFLNFSPRLPLDAQRTTWTLHDDSGRALVVGGGEDDGAEPDAEGEPKPDGEAGGDGDASGAPEEQDGPKDAGEHEALADEGKDAVPGDAPEGEQPAGEQPEGEQPEREQPEGAQPDGEKPEGDKPEGDKPGADKPAPKGPEIYEGPLTYQLHMNIGEQSDAKTAQVRVGETTVRGDDANAKQDVENLYNARVWSYVIDRGTGEAEEPAKLTHTIAMPESEVDVDGYWLKFPAHAEKTNYPVFDPTLRQAREAVFAEETEIEGRTVYRYHQEFEPENVAKLYAGMLNTTSLPTPEGGSEQGFLFHGVSNDFYVDQETGMLVGMDVDIDDYYGTGDGERAYDALQFAGRTSDKDRAAFLQQAEDIPDQTAARIARWVVGGLGGLLTVLGLLGALGAFGRRGGKTSGRKGQARATGHSRQAGNARPVSTARPARR